VGTVLTFDKEDNKAAAAMADVAAFVVPEALDKGFIDFHCAVKSQAFGMAVSDSKDGHATVHAVTAGTPAEAAGIKVGDVLVGVAGKAVNTSSWRAALEKSALPTSLRFRRPAALNVPNPKAMTGKSD
jgi:C-terminal processing protease CtpA/Prc